MSTARVNINTSEYVRVNFGFNPMTLQATRDQVRIAFSDNKPVPDNQAFMILQGDDVPLQFNQVSTNVWAKAATDRSALTVTEIINNNEPPASNDSFDINDIGQLLVNINMQQRVLTEHMLTQMELMNARIEEAFQTRIKIGDVSHVSRRC